MITRLKIENFKSIQSQQIELKSLNVLIGQNGAGKSNFISFFTFLGRLAEQRLAEYIFQKGGINTFLFGGYEKSEFLQIILELTEYSGHFNFYEFAIESNGIEYGFFDEKVGYSDHLLPTNINRFGTGITLPSNMSSIQSKANEAGLKDSDHTYSSFIYSFIKNLRVYHFHDTSDNAKCKLPQDIDDIYQLKREAENIAAFLFFLKNQHSSNYNQIVETIRLVYPQFHDFELAEMPTAKGKIILRWTEKGNENVYFPKQISDGTLRFICLATLLLQPMELTVPETIILDEPELGLHPFAIHVLSELIKKCSLQKQIILATQSVTLINYFQPEDLLIVERNKEGASEFKRKDTESLKEWLEDYTLGQLWKTTF